MPAPKLFSRVAQASTTTGTASYLLGATPQGYLPFSAKLAHNEQCWYTATDGVQWETGIGTFQISGGSHYLARTTIIENSAGTTSRIDWGPGTRDVFMCPPGARMVTMSGLNIIALERMDFEKAGANLIQLTYGASNDFGAYDQTAGMWAWRWEWNFNGAGGKRLRIPQLVYANTLAADAIELGGQALGTAALSNAHTPITGTSQAASTTSVTLAANESSVNNIYNDLEITMLTGPATGQTREIVSYNGVTKVATVSPAFSPAPSAGGGDTYQITTGPARANMVIRTTSAGKLDPRLVARMGAASAAADGTPGIPLHPKAGEHRRFLRGDNTWTTPDNRYVESWRTSWANGNTYTQAHSLGAHPNEAWLELDCTTPEYGYTSGDRIRITGFAEQGTSRGVTVWANATNVGVAIGSAGIAIARRDTTGIGVITPANWRIRLVAVAWW